VPHLIFAQQRRPSPHLSVNSGSRRRFYLLVVKPSLRLRLAYRFPSHTESSVPAPFFRLNDDGGGALSSGVEAQVLSLVASSRTISISDRWGGGWRSRTCCAGSGMLEGVNGQERVRTRVGGRQRDGV